MGLDLALEFATPGRKIGYTKREIKSHPIVDDSDQPEETDIPVSDIRQTTDQREDQRPQD